MDKQYKEWLQEQTFETLATDNYNVKLLLLAEQAKNKKLVEALEDCKEIAKTLYITGSDFLPLATYYKDIINTADMALNEVNDAK